jgi:hypothetical protein
VERLGAQITETIAVANLGRQTLVRRSTSDAIFAALSGSSVPRATYPRVAVSVVEHLGVGTAIAVVPLGRFAALSW